MTATAATAVPAADLSTVEGVAYRDGLAAGLRAILDPAAPVPATPEGYTLLPAGSTALAERAGLTVLPHPLAATEGLVLVRLDGWARPGRTGPEGARYALPLVAVRLGLLRRMLDAAVTHLAGRQSDGAPLTARQLVQAAVADVATTLETCRHALGTAGPSIVDCPDAGDWLHARLDRADLTVATMFGGSGFLRDHPVRCLHVAALVREAWAPGGPTDHGWES